MARQLTREQLCEEVHLLLDLLQSHNRPPAEAVPDDGVYFWYEAGEVRRGRGQRITRVGAHREPHRLHQRITLHYNADRDRSVFRRHVGGALMKKAGEPEPRIQEWYEPRRSSQFTNQILSQYEHQVSKEIKRGVYRVLRVENAPERLELEQKLISLLSRCEHCRPSTTWLGNWAYRSQIRRSGLWNVRHVFSDSELQAGELVRLEQLVSATRVF